MNLDFDIVKITEEMKKRQIPADYGISEYKPKKLSPMEEFICTIRGFYLCPLVIG